MENIASKKTTKRLHIDGVVQEKILETCSHWIDFNHYGNQRTGCLEDEGARRGAGGGVGIDLGKGRGGKK